MPKSQFGHGTKSHVFTVIARRRWCERSTPASSSRPIDGTTCEASERTCKLEFGSRPRTEQIPIQPAVHYVFAQITQGPINASQASLEANSFSFVVQINSGSPTLFSGGCYYGWEDSHDMKQSNFSRRIQPQQWECSPRRALIPGAE